MEIPPKEREVCLVCNREAAAIPIDSYAGKNHAYTLHECDHCRAQFWTPFKNPGASWYEHDERYASRNADPILAPNEKHLAVIDALTTPPGRVLDVGCGVGNFLALAKARGWETWGIDFDKDAIEAARHTFDLAHLSVASLQEFVRDHPNLRFDLITFFDVFEHLDDHEVFLKTVRELLAPGGHIALSVPYRHAWRWLIPNDLPPRHLTRWNEESLRIILARHGLTPSYTYRLAASIYFIALKLRFRYGRWASIGLVQGVKTRSETRNGMNSQTTAGAGTITIVHFLAKSKDLLLFGLPALVIWLLLLPTRARYTDLTVVAYGR